MLARILSRTVVQLNESAGLSEAFRRESLHNVILLRQQILRDGLYL
jgi:hypothetical protein